MKFIKLTKKFGDGEALINPLFITALESQPGGGVCVYTMGGQTWVVTESVEVVQDKIKASEKYTVINHDQK